jgi:tetratricopeptide (TPR) repeat protein
MIRRLSSYLFILLLLLSAVRLEAVLSAEIQAIITAYNNGERSRCENLLNRAKPQSNEEEATVKYYKALLSHDAEIARALLQSIIDLNPKLNLAQNARLELGKLYLLDREYDKALAHFNSITSPDLDEKHFWIANVYYEKEDFSNAIASANQYLRQASVGEKAEEAYYLIADAYIELRQYNNAISTLKKLLSKPALISDEQYLRYRYGYACELLGNRSEALSQYRQGYELNRFSQLAYMIEDRLFEMRSTYGYAIDLSFLYPYCASPPPDIVLAEQNKNSNDIPAGSDTTSVVKNNNAPEIDFSNQQGLYLQAGRFSKQDNAIRLCEKIGKLNLHAQYYKVTQQQDVSWVVIVGSFPSQLDAVNAKSLLRDNGIDSFIIQK